MTPHDTPDPPTGSHARLPRRSIWGKRRIKVASLALALVVGLVWWIHRVPFEPQSVPLKTGGMLTLIAVEGAQVHYSPFEPPWQRYFVRIPTAWRTRWKLRVADTFESRVVPLPGSPTPTKVLGLWFAFPTNGPAGYLVARIEDEAGRPFGLARGESVGSTRDGGMYVGLMCEIVPRRSEWLRIVVGDRDEETIGNLGTFRVRNPLYEPTATTFAAGPLPQTVRDGDLAFTLGDLVVATNESAPVANWPAVAKWPIARATFSVTRGGRPTAVWRPDMEFLADSTGNQLIGGILSAGENPRPDGTVDFHALPGNEAWKMKVSFIQCDGFATNEVWRLRSLPIAPREGQSPAGGGAETKTRMRGKELKVEFLAVDSRRSPAVNDVPGEVHATLRLFSSTDNDPMTAHIILLHAVDDHGRDVTPLYPIGRHGDFHFDLSPGARAMDLDIAFTECRRVWFTARASPVPALTDAPDRR